MKKTDLFVIAGGLLAGYASAYAGTAIVLIPHIQKAAEENEVPPELLLRLIIQESAFRPEIVLGILKSRVGAIGVAQFMPATAKEWLGSEDAAYNPFASIDGAARYMAWLYKQTGSWYSAVAAYNWGVGNVKKKGLAAMPEETRKYVAFVAKGYQP